MIVSRALARLHLWLHVDAHMHHSQDEMVVGIAFDDPLDAVRCAHGAQHLMMLQAWPTNASHILGPKEETLDGMPVYYGPRFAMVVHHSADFTCVCRW